MSQAQLQTMIDRMPTSALARAEASQMRAAALGCRIDTNYLGMLRTALAERRRLSM